MLIGSQQRLDKILETPNILCGEHQIKRVREKTVLGLKNVGKATIVIMSYSPNHPPARVVNEGKADQKLKINL
jgi:hypothetical protein